MIVDRALLPMDTGFLGAVRTVLEPNSIAHLIQPLSGSLCHYQSPAIWSCARNGAVIPYQLALQGVPAGDVVQKISGECESWVLLATYSL